MENLPPPRPLTEEDRKRIIEEAREWSKEFRKMVAAMENLTAEDLAFRVK